MSNYEKANGDNRDVLERYLPAIFRRATDGSEEHNAFLGALKGMISTAESDLTENVKQVYLSKASGSFLDLYGKWVGLSRSTDELDDDYRIRIEDYILTERATISGIIAGIRRDMNDPELPVTIYEPWRNIFILNKSLLNGPDRIMGNFYRYAVIQVTVGKYIDKDTLDSIIMKYKAYGIYVYYTYSSSMTGDALQLPISLVGTGSITTTRTPIYNNYQFSINDLPNGSTTDNLFIVNDSDLNSDKLLAGSPEGTFAYQYGTAPSKNIFGIIPTSVSPSSYTDPYDYVYQNVKIVDPNSSTDYIYPYKAISYVNMGRKDGIVETFIPSSTKKSTFAFNISEYMSNNGYASKLSTFNRDTTDSIVLSIENSPYGISTTSISVYGTSGSLVGGTWYTYDNGVKGQSVGSTIPASSSSSKSYIYILSSKQSVSKLVINDYYPGIGSHRDVSLLSSGSLLRVYNTKEQTIGTITIPNSLTLNSLFINAYVESINIDYISNKVGLSVYDYSVSKWISIDDTTNLLSYISTGTTTGATYLLIRSNVSTSMSIDYIGLKIKSYA